MGGVDEMKYCEDIEDKTVVYQAAQLVKEKSTVKNFKRVKVIYTQKSNLTKGEKVGEVIIRSNKKCKHVFV